ncbi:hypothetical protein PDJAM_G00195050 [Pangasius djambal]|uniref:Uncharacterized protein n=1 Tax=Pangasius djambal TaxID=1691987 RepID=A0ACC5ZQ82_9TELE|nr:hypothetical protein [Pangasius djambal]
MARMKQEQLHEQNMRTETWCCVEADSRVWDRPERRHFVCHLRNTCDVRAMVTPNPEERASWMTRRTSYREKRHYDESYKSHFI